MRRSRDVLLTFVAAFLATATVVAGLRADPTIPIFPGSRQLGDWNIAHQTSVVHVAGVVRAFGPSGTNVVDATNAALNVNCVVGCSGSSAANPIPHVSSVTHIVGSLYLTNRAGTAVTVTSTSLDVNCTAGCSGGVNTPVNQAGIWTIQGSHQLGEWNIRHVSSVSHVYGTVSLVARDGTYAAFTTTSLNVNITNAPSVAQSGEWNIRHIGSRLHVVLIPSSNANDVIAVHATQTGTWTVQPGNTVNTSAWLIQQAHASSVRHIAGYVYIRDAHCATCWARVDHFNTLVVQKHIGGAIRAWQVSQCGTTARTVVASNANRREIRLTNQGTSNIYIGYGATGHVALTATNGWPMHAASGSTGLAGPVILTEYQGPIACVTDLQGQTLGVLEVLR